MDTQNKLLLDFNGVTFDIDREIIDKYEDSPLSVIASGRQDEMFKIQNGRYLIDRNPDVF